MGRLIPPAQINIFLIVFKVLSLDKTGVVKNDPISQLPSQKYIFLEDDHHITENVQLTFGIGNSTDIFFNVCTF